jgi:hypothetical protein
MGRAERGVAQNIRIWSVTLIEPRFAEAVQIGGYAGDAASCAPNGV